MKKLFALTLAMVLLALAGCRSDTPLPSETKETSGSTEQSSVTAEATQESAPPSSASTQPSTAPTQPKQIKDMTFDEFMAQEYVYTRFNATDWTVEGDSYDLGLTEQGLVMYCPDSQTRPIPGTEHLSGHALIGCNGDFAIVSNETQILQVSIETGRIQPITGDRETVLGVWLCEDYFLYYALYSKDLDRVRIFLHSLLPEDQQLLIIPVQSYNTPLGFFRMEKPESNEKVRWYTMSSAMLVALQQELKDPNGYLMISALRDDPLRIYDPAYLGSVEYLCYHLQTSQNIYALTRYTRYLESDKIVEMKVSLENPNLYASSPTDIYCFIFRGEQPFYNTPVDITNCVAGGLYVWNKEEDTVTEITAEPVLNYCTTKEHVYYVPKETPGKILRAPFAGGAPELIYTSDGRSITELHYHGNAQSGMLSIGLEQKQILLYDMKTKTSTVLLDVPHTQFIFDEDLQQIMYYSADGKYHLYDLFTGETEQRDIL